jgi:hypothetical protein
MTAAIEAVEVVVAHTRAQRHGTLCFKLLQRAWRLLELRWVTRDGSQSVGTPYVLEKSTSGMIADQHPGQAVQASTEGVESGKIGSERSSPFCMSLRIRTEQQESVKITPSRRSGSSTTSSQEAAKAQISAVTHV